MKLLLLLALVVAGCGDAEGLPLSDSGAPVRDGGTGEAAPSTLACVDSMGNTYFATRCR